MSQGWSSAPPPTRKRGRGCLIAVAAAAGLGLLAIGCLAVVASDQGEVVSPATPKATSRPAAKRAGPGDSVRDGQFEFVVQRIRCGVEQVGGEFLNKQAQGQYCLVSVRVENIGDDQRTFEQSSQYLYDIQGRRYGTDEAGLYLPEAKSFLEEINPGNAVDGVLVYDVPKTFKAGKIELHDSALSGGATVEL